MVAYWEAAANSAFKSFLTVNLVFSHFDVRKVQVGKDQEKAQLEKDSKNRNGERTKLTIRYLYHENIS